MSLNFFKAFEWHVEAKRISSSPLVSANLTADVYLTSIK